MERPEAMEGGPVAEANARRPARRQIKCKLMASPEWRANNGGKQQSKAWSSS